MARPFDVSSSSQSKNPKSSIGNRQSILLPMGFALNSPADQSVRLSRKFLLVGTDFDDELSGIGKPIGIAEYQLVRALPEPLDTCLPSIEQIEAELGRIGH